VILLVDAARLWKGEVDGLFQPYKSAVLAKRIPAHLRGKDDGQGSQWFGFSTRARVIVYNKSSVQPGDVDTYEKLADARNKGRLCTRSGSHPYNLSLFGAVTEHLGPQKAEAWLQGLVNNMARPPKGGDTDQIKAVASGECGIGLTNSYYVARLMRSNSADDKAVMEKVGVIFPNQKTWGTHLNISGAGIAKYARNVEAAQKFLEYLASDAAQAYFANGNNEWPVVSTVKVNNKELAAMGTFKPDQLPIGDLAKTTVQAQKVFDRAGWK
jgi:iron(III) transport system substrate-binding protein